MPFTITMPKLSPTMEEGTIVKWHKKEGEFVASGEILLEVSTDKATVEYEALDAGYLRKILVKEGGSAKVNEPILICTEKKEESIEGYVPEGMMPKKEVLKKQEVALEEKKVETVKMEQPAFIPEPPLAHYNYPFSSEKVERVKASPLAKKKAEEKKVDLTTVKGTGPGGRITEKDLALAKPKGSLGFEEKIIPTTPPGTYEEIPLTPMRKVIGTRLQQAKSYIPHIYVRQEIDAEPLVNIREQLKMQDVKLSLNDFVIRAVALSLREHLSINSGFHSVHQSILLFKTIDISVAVSIEGGLITPIIRHADYKTIQEIHVEALALANKAKAGALKPEEFKGGSFTISNMGMFGISDFCAIINPPQSSILAVGGIEECPRVKNGAVVVGKRMNLILSSDHRVVDGTDAAKFLKTLQKYLENPAFLLL